MRTLLRLRPAMLVAALLSYAGAAFAQAPVITLMSKHSGLAGTSVVLTGTNFTGATAVQFGSGATTATFTVDLPTQITATVPVGALPGVISVTNPSGTGASPLAFYPGPVLTTTGGPVFPPPLGHTFSMTGLPNDASISRAGGKTFVISNVPLASTRLVSFGPQANGVGLSFQFSDLSGPGDILTFQPSLSNLPGGVAVWTGSTTFFSGQPVFTRFTMTATDTLTTLPIPLVAATDIGQPATIGALHGILPGQSFSVNHRFDASYTNGSGYAPALDVFDAYTGAKTSAYSSYYYGYYYDNTPPRLTVNTGLVVAQGASSPVTDAKLKAVDDDGADSQITFTVAGGPFQGTLLKGVTPLANGGTFTQQDIVDGLMSYTHNNSCNAADSFTFSATDALGGVMSDVGFTVFNFNVAAALINLPPVPTDGSFSVGLGASANSTLSATNTDCFTPTYTFAIVTPPTKGALSGFNPATGAFTYTATLGQSGADSFTFSVNDGVLGSVAPGSISITIGNQPPVVTPQSPSTFENTAVGGTAVAIDVDLPPQAMTWSIGTNGAKGTAVINLTSGAFTYTPAAGRFGMDTFTVIANDGALASAPATFRVDIRPQLLVGRVLVNSDDPVVAANRLVLLVNPANGDLGLVAQSASFNGLRGVTYGTSGVVVVNSGDTSLYRVSGPAPVLVGPVDPSAPIGPVGIATEANGNFLVGQGSAGVGRYSPSGALLTGYTGGNLQLVSDVAVAANGDIYAADAGALTGGNNKIVKIDPGSGVQTLLASGGVLNSGGFPLAIAVDINGDIYVAQGNPSSAGGSVLKVTAAGVVTTLSNNGLINGPAGITFGGANELIVSNNQSGSLVKVEKTSGTQTMLYSGGPLSKPWGVRRVEIVGQNYYTLAPCRVLDTRNPAGPLGGPALVAQADRTFTVAGTCAIPPDAKALSLNIAVTQPTGAGNIRLHPGGTAVPLVSAINYKTGQTRSNNAVIPLSASGQLAAFLDQVAGTAHLIVDVNGYFK